MPLTSELVDKHIYDGRYKGAAVILAATDLPREKRASRLVQFAKSTDRSVKARENARTKLASVYREELKAAK